MSKNLQSKLTELLESGELFQIVDDSLSLRQVLYKLGFSAKGQYGQLVKQFLLSNDFDTSHFTASGRPKLKQITKTCPCCF